MIGAISLVDESYAVSDKSIRMLLDEIINSSTEKFAVLQNCGERLDEFVIALRDRGIYKNKFMSETTFTNDNGKRTLIITKNASHIGNSIEEICEYLNTEYLQALAKSNFSRDRHNRKWRPFDDNEKEVIKAIWVSAI